MKRIMTVTALLLCLLMLTSPAALAAQETGAAASVPFLNEQELQALVETYISEHGQNPEHLSVGYVYTETGETWYYNPDAWFYGASTYKVPLMMILAEREYQGELTQESDIAGLTLAYAEQSILTYSNNDFGHLMMRTIGNGNEADCVDLFKNYASLPDDYYVPDFREYRYFTARFLTEVMTTLFQEPERFPHVIDCLLVAQPGEYFRTYLDDYGLSVAQKYGSLVERNGTNDNHTYGIIYTPHPIILTVMTIDDPAPNRTIADLAKIFVDYTLEIDGRLEQYRAEEAARLATVQTQQAPASEDTQPEPAQDVPAPVSTTETAPAVSVTSEEEPAGTENPVQEQGGMLRLYVLLGFMALMIVLIVLRVRMRRR